jgi:hypothetical protein
MSVKWARRPGGDYSRDPRSGYDRDSPGELVYEVRNFHGKAKTMNSFTLADPA